MDIPKNSTSSDAHPSLLEQGEPDNDNDGLIIPTGMRDELSCAFDDAAPKMDAELSDHLDISKSKFGVTYADDI